MQASTEGSIVASIDWWCPNCEQSVKPKEKAAPQQWMIGLGIWIGLGIALTMLGFGSWSGAFAALVGLVVARGVADKYTIRSCPICQTENLQPVAPDNPTAPSEP